MSGTKHWEQDKEATVYVGNLDERVNDSLVWELMLQAGRIVNVHLPKDRVTQIHQGYGFVEFISEEDAEYAARIMNQIRLFGKPIRVNKASADKQKTAEIGAELFIGNLDPMVTEQVLLDTFQRFGALISPPKVARDDAGLSKGYGFVSFSSFESSDEAVMNLHGQYLMNKEVSVQYAYKKDGKGERHGDQAERMLAAQARQHNVQPPAQIVNGAAAGEMSSSVISFDTDSTQLRGLASSTLPHSRPLAMSTFATPNMHQRSTTSSQTLPPPPSGLPARPPPSQAGYGGPSPGYLPQGFVNSNTATTNYGQTGSMLATHATNVPGDFKRTR